MHTPIKFMLGAALCTLATFSVAATSSGTESSSITITGASSGHGKGKGHWESGVKEGIPYIRISDTGKQQIPGEGMKMKIDSEVYLQQDPKTGKWSGTSTPKHCHAITMSAKIACEAAGEGTPIQLTSVDVDLEKGFIHQSSVKDSPIGVVTTKVRYTLKN